MDYSFNLEWSDLPEELRELKIDEVIEYDFGCSNIDPSEYDGLDSALADPALRSRTEDYCSCHFPIYF